MSAKWKARLETAAAIVFVIFLIVVSILALSELAISIGNQVNDHFEASMLENYFFQ